MDKKRRESGSTYHHSTHHLKFRVRPSKDTILPDQAMNRMKQS